MAKKKTFNLTSLASSEAKDLERLSLQARKGWLLNDIKIPFLSYELVETNGVERDYLIDFNDDVTEDYLSNYKKKGWNYVCSNGALHYFYAFKNTLAFYTNQAKKQQLYQAKAKHFLLVFALLAVLDGLAAWGFLSFRAMENPNQPIMLLLFASTILLSVMSVYFFYASYSYYSRAKRIKKEIYETSNT